MTSWRVTFFKNLVNSNGHQFKCPQGTIEIRRARDLHRALQAAKRRYERAKKIGHWTLYADVAELESVAADGSSLQLTEPASHEHFVASPCERRGAVHTGHAAFHSSFAP
ncbi:hypothetical protein [Mesorhizobium captivum]|uniref:hypothetical protein n=1 Tax=Mesorhizobium captivum TaxID=3072319 RepID=UPI002A24CC4C|nr:hypothetical protein [Mesorhizobium sp. VK3C]MDX8449475.1 hypothetical protein [Mesorhizobium sp. VK3C]